METPKPEARPRKTRRIVIALALSAIVVASGLFVWDFVRTRSLSQVFGWDHWRAGNTVTVTGTITSIERANTSDGPRVYLGLDNNRQCGGGGGSVFGDPNGTYRLGAAFQTTLHFQAYTINGDPAVSAPELHCPFPLLMRAIGIVGDAASLHAGRLLLAYNGTAANGTLHYEIVTGNGAAYRPDKLSVTLRKSTPIRGSNPRLPAGGPVDSAARWTEFGAFQFLLSLAYTEAPVVDRMRSLAAGISQNGSLRYADVNRNGLLDDGDRVDVNLAPTGSPTTYDTYLLMIGGTLSSDETYVFASRYVLNGPRGPVDIPLRERPEPYVELHHAQGRFGTSVSSDLGVTRRFGPAPTLSSLRFYLDTRGSYRNGSLSDLPITLGNGVTLALNDTNGNGRLDNRDVFHVGNLVNGSSVTLNVNLGDGVEVATISWIVGYGEPIGRFPLYWFSAQGTGPWRVTATVAFWSPELAFNGTFRASLQESGVAVLTNVSLRNGTLGTFANGSLAFTDVDGDGTLSTGDRFIVTGVSGNRYSLDLSLFNNLAQRVNL